jgi:hypothetical protein
MLSEVETVPDLPPGERSYGNRTIPNYQALFVSRGESGLSAKLDEPLLHQKTRRKIIRTEVRKSELERIKFEKEAALKTSMRAAKGVAGRGNLPQAMKDAKDSAANQNPTNVTSDIISAAETAAAELQEEDRDDGDPELLEDIANQGNRMQPVEWEEIPESVQAAVQVDHNGELPNDNEVPHLVGS